MLVSSLRRSALGLLVLLAGLSFGTSAMADEPELVADHDPNILPPSGTGARVFWTGAALTAGWYGVSYGTSYLWQDSPGAKDLRIPVAGPFMALASTGCGSKERPGCSKFQVVLRTIITGLSAVGQVGGVAAMAEALFVPTQPHAVRGASLPPAGGVRLSLPYSVREAGTGTGSTDSLGADEVTLSTVPVVFGTNGVGLGLLGHF